MIGGQIKSVIGGAHHFQHSDVALAQKEMRELVRNRLSNSWTVAAFKPPMRIEPAEAEDGYVEVIGTCAGYRLYAYRPKEAR